LPGVERKIKSEAAVAAKQPTVNSWNLMPPFSSSAITLAKRDSG